ncbi:MAG TPA: hypothetical protein V6D20_18015, partial [Candidatus Obscuribacterales bacterium]
SPPLPYSLLILRPLSSSSSAHQPPGLLFGRQAMQQQHPTELESNIFTHLMDEVQVLPCCLMPTGYPSCGSR